MAEEIKRIVCGLCSSHCRLEARVEDGQFLGIEYHKKSESAATQRWHEAVAGCLRAQAARDFVYHPERLNYPLKRAGDKGENKWERISWETALDEITEKLTSIRDTYGPEAVAFSCAGEHNCLTEYRLRFLNLLGSPNFIDHLQICYGPAIELELMTSGYMMHFPYLRPETNCVMLLGTNPSIAWTYLWRVILEKQSGGTKLIVVDPRRTDSAMRADIWLQPRPATDSALLLGMVNVIIAEGLYDKDFVGKWCYGFDRLAERAKQYPPETVAEITWVPADKIREAARVYATTKPAAIFGGMGIEEVSTASRSLQLRCILPAITGNLDVLGGDPLTEPNPNLRIMAEVEGYDLFPPDKKDLMIGADRFRLCSWEAWELLHKYVKKVRKEPLSAGWIWGGAHPPMVFRAMLTGEPYPVRAVIQDSQNPLLTLPNSKLIYEALKSVDLHVAMDVFMTPSCMLADYVLPAACCFEKPVLRGGDYYPYFDAGVAAIPPLHERKPEYYLWRELGLRLGQAEYWPWETVEEALDYRLEPMGYTFNQFVEEKGYDNLPLKYRKYEEKGFGTPTGKFELYSTVLEELGYDPLPCYEEPPKSIVSDPELAKEYPLILITGGRVATYYQSQYRQFDSMRKRHPDPLAQINPEKAVELGINDGDWIWIETQMGRVKFKCKYFNGIDPRVVHAEHGWWFPEDPGEEPSLHGVWRSNSNAVLDDDPDLCDPLSGAWPMRGQMCKVYKVED
ncbi:molybdopterin-dependent oxidoreductase [Chloroflexota bacterium]